MMIEVPDAELANLGLTDAKARIELAAGLYAGGEVTLGRAARIAGVSTTVFMHELGKRGICLSYSVEDARLDVESVQGRLGK